MSENHKAWAGLGARLFLGGLLAFSGFLKAASPAEEFAAVVENYRLLPVSFVLVFASVMPWVELLLGLFLFFGNFTSYASLGAAAMLFSFITALVWASLTGAPMDKCGCFGSMVSLTPLQAVALDCFLLFLAYLSFRHGSRLFSADSWLKKG